MATSAFDSYIDKFQDAEAFRDACDTLAQDIGIELEWLYGIFYVECGFNPWVVNNQSHAIGLIQFLPSTLAAMGYTPYDIDQMTPTQQVTVVRKYLMPYKNKIATFQDLYLAVFAPHAGLGNGENPDYVLYPAGSVQAQKNKAAQNADGSITIGSFFAAVKKRLPASVQGFVSFKSVSIGLGVVVAGVAVAWLLMKKPSGKKKKTSLKKGRRKN